MSRIVLIDDERILNESLKDLIEVMGHEVESFYSLVTAMDTADFSSTDLVICDVGLPGEDVFDLMKGFKKRFNIPFVFLSAFTSEDYKKKSEASGADRYLVKPASIETLKKTFRDFLPVKHE